MIIIENQKVFLLRHQDIFLRSSLDADVERFVKWHTIETDWLQWDSPWANHQADPDEIRARIKRILARPRPKIWRRLQICLANGAHIGSVMTFFENKEERFIGIFIAEKDCWGRGLGEQALKLWLAYLFNVTAENWIYCGTWSGNHRMIKLAAKCGFVEIDKQKNLRQIAGKYYDGITFKLEKEVFFQRNQDLVKDISEQLIHND